MPTLPFFSPAKDELIVGKIVGSGFRKRYFSIPHHVRSKHAYIVGKTGKGKSRLLEHMLLSDIEAGRGCGLIDPHGDLVQDCIATLYTRGFFQNPDARERVIYINPASRSYVTPFNVLTVSSHDEVEIYKTVRYVINTIKRAWRDVLSSAPNFEDIMENSLVLLIKTGRTLIELPQLFNPDTAFRDGLLNTINDPKLNDFFHNRFDALSKGSSADRKESSLNKVNPFRTNPYLELALGQGENWIDFRRFMDEGKTVLMDLGQCDEDSQAAFGNFFTHGFEQAAFSRYDVAREERKPFFLYIDEFQDFSTASHKSLPRILSGARKFGLHLTLAHQNLSQFENPRMRGAVFGNVATKIFFGISEFDALELAPAIGLGHIDPQEIKHEAQTDSQHPIYQSIPEQQVSLASLLANQQPRRAIVRDNAGKKIEIETLPLADTDLLPADLFYQVIKPYGIPLEVAKANVERIY